MSPTLIYHLLREASNLDELVAMELEGLEVLDMVEMLEVPEALELEALELEAMIPSQAKDIVTLGMVSWGQRTGIGARQFRVHHPMLSQ